MNHPWISQHLQRSSSYTSDHTERCDDIDDDDIDNHNNICITINPMMISMSQVHGSSNAIESMAQATTSEAFSDLNAMTSSIDYMTLKKQKDVNNKIIDKKNNSLTMSSNSCRPKKYLSDDIDISTDVDDDNDGVGIDCVVKEDKVINDINSIFDFLLPKMNNDEEYSKRRRMHDISNNYDMNRIVIDYHNISIAIEHNRINMKYDAIEDKKHEQFDHNIKTIALIDSFKDHYSIVDNTSNTSSILLSTSLSLQQPSQPSYLTVTTTIINDGNSDDNVIKDDLRLSPTTILASQMDSMSITSHQSDEDLLNYNLVTSSDYEYLII